VAVIRHALPLDLAEVDVIERASFADPWSLQSFRQSLARTFVRINVAEDEEAGIVGYSVVWMAGDECELANLAVDPRRRGSGLGTLLLDAVLQEAHEEGSLVMFLEVRASNAAARQLYASRGFHEVGRRTAYYRNPEEDALVLRRDLG
jgi:[ribosomal protein S18]-alanine N-acetyltransferase